MTCFPLSEWSSSVDKLEALELDLDRDVCDDEPGAGSIDDEGDGRGGSSGFSPAVIGLAMAAELPMRQCQCLKK